MKFTRIALAAFCTALLVAVGCEKDPAEGTGIHTKPVDGDGDGKESGEGYTDFSFDIRPSVDFISELQSKIDSLDVLEPASLKARIREILEAALRRNP